MHLFIIYILKYFLEMLQESIVGLFLKIHYLIIKLWFIDLCIYDIVKCFQCGVLNICNFLVKDHESKQK